MDEHPASKPAPPGQAGHRHAGKFTEGRLDNDLIVKSLGLKTGQVVMDAGCGNGYMAKIFAARVGPTGRVVALDPDKHFIQVLTGETAGTAIEPFQGDITRPTGLAGGSFDLVYISTVFHGFSATEKEGFFTEARRLLKPGGRLAIVEVDKKETNFGPPLAIRVSPAELRALAPLAAGATVRVAADFYMQVFRNEPPGRAGRDRPPS